jgi:hypothetical protein
VEFYPFFGDTGTGQRINNNRRVCFVAGNDLYYGEAGSQLADLPMITPPLSAQPTALGTPTLNNNDAMAFAVVGQNTNFPGGAIFESVAGAAPDLIVQGAGRRVGFMQPALNDAGDLAYLAADPTTFATSLRFLRSGSQTPTVVLASGDTLFGSAVTVGIAVSSVGFRSLNRSGQIAFSYTLANGARGIALASPNQ